MSRAFAMTHSSWLSYAKSPSMLNFFTTMRSTTRMLHVGLTAEQRTKELKCNQRRNSEQVGKQCYSLPPLSLPVDLPFPSGLEFLDLLARLRLRSSLVMPLPSSVSRECGGGGGGGVGRGGSTEPTEHFEMRGSDVHRDQLTSSGGDGPYDR